jgi:hypothetical protein
MPELNR